MSREKQSLIDARSKSLAKAEMKIEELTERIRLENEENKALRSSRNKLHEAVKEILELTECNKYDNEKAFLSRIKELAQTAIQY